MKKKNIFNLFIFLFVFLLSSCVNKNNDKITKTEEKIELTSSKIENNIEYYIGENVELQIKIEASELIEFYSFENNLEVQEQTLNDKKYLIEDNIITLKTKVETANEIISSDSLNIYAFKNNTFFSFDVPVYSWNIKTKEIEIPDDEVTETKLEHYNVFLNSSIDDSSEMPTKALTNDNIIIEEYYYLNNDDLNLTVPRIIFKNGKTFEANSVIQLTNNYYLARYILKFVDFYENKKTFGFDTYKEYGFKLANEYDYAQEEFIVSNSEWDKCALSYYQNYFNIYNFRHTVEDFTLYDQLGIVLQKFDFKNSSINFEINEQIFSEDKTVFYDGTYENIYSIFSEEEFKYFLYWTYGLLTPSNRFRENYNNLMSITGHIYNRYILKGRWLVTKDINISNFVDETIIQKYLEGDTNIKFNEQIFNYGVILDGSFDFNNHTIKYENLDYDGNSYEEHYKAVFDKNWNAIWQSKNIDLCLGGIKSSLTFSNYKTFSKYLTAFNLDEFCDIISETSVKTEYDEFYQDYRYILFACLNESSIINVNYNYNNLNISEETFNDLLLYKILNESLETLYYPDTIE